MEDKVAVVLPTYNGQKWLANAIDSVINQTYQNINLYIIDDGSTDNTNVIIRRYIKENSGKIFEFKKKGIKGAPSSRDEVIRTISAKYIAFIDQDDFWEKTKIKDQIKQIKNEKAQLNHTNIKILQDGKFNNILKENHKRNKYNYTLKKYDLAKKIIIYSPIRIGTVLIERDSYLGCGGFDVNLSGGEDWDFWVRYALNGYQISHNKKILAIRRLHGENTSIKRNKERLKSWLSAAKKLSAGNKQVRNAIRFFYLITYLRSCKKIILSGNIKQWISHSIFFLKCVIK